MQEVKIGNKKKGVLELCAGGGGQFLGLEAAGFECVGAVEIEAEYCRTLHYNRPKLNIINADLKHFDAKSFIGVDLVAGGVPCPPFSIAGKQFGQDDDRDLFPYALKIIRQTSPKAVLLENVPGLALSKFDSYRQNIQHELAKLGYWSEWKILNASDFGVPQLRPRLILVALTNNFENTFEWPKPLSKKITVGKTLFDLMAENGWTGAKKWSKKANGIGPTLVGGSKKHGGPDLGPTRARQQWKNLGVDGIGIADSAPDIKFPEDGLPRLTVRMTARVQGFPDSWQFPGRKTASYRQIGNAFPPAVAKAVGTQILTAI
ncbi:MAG: DNA cytosine methyltransferase [Candidatus Methanoperedens sp.]|jgi:DNA (cytosine-5)-methyltransferase 1|nr:DNA cytosine methyltransferase [Candidatus Methanoperedens sp.]PKL53139.1 MAG: DNA (cytosine-5-)-methyltransferase [Candidatus Methanoperedenaceae archaeon HGW-Methanoperedenaceae-1]